MSIGEFTENLSQANLSRDHVSREIGRRGEARTRRQVPHLHNVTDYNIMQYDMCMYITMYVCIHILAWPERRFGCVRVRVR